MTTPAKTPSKPPELASHADFLAAYAARVKSVHAVRDEELAEIDRARTRAEVGFTKALEAVEVEHRAERLARNATVVTTIVTGLRVAARSFAINRDIGRSATFGEKFRAFEEKASRELGRPLKDELALAFALEALERAPEALPRFSNPSAWNPILGDGLTGLAHRAGAALRNPYDLPAMHTALLQLESGVARVAATGQLYDPEMAPEVWALRLACLPGDLEEARTQEILKAAKIRRGEAATAERALQYAAVMGDEDARRKIEARGEGALRSVLDGASAIVHWVTGRVPLAHEAERLQAGMGGT